MQDDIRSEEMSQEDIRREMRERFDATNNAAEERHKSSREANTITNAREDQRWIRADSHATTAPQDANDRGDIGGNNAKDAESI